MVAQMNNELIELLEKNAGEGNTPIRQAVTTIRQQQEKLNKYELRYEEQRNRITYLEAKLSEALDAENDRRFE